MNAQTRNWIASAERYAVEFAGNLDPIISLTEDEIGELAREQMELSIEQAENADGVDIDDLRGYGLDAIFFEIIQDARNAARLATAKPAKAAGPNVWASKWDMGGNPLDMVKCEYRPSHEFHPVTSATRIHGSSYSPYTGGNSEWREAANRQLASAAKSNFANRR